jgi:signal transduction histidine kinase
MSAYLFASSGVSLVVALFNALLGGYVLAGAKGDARKAFFVCGPAGVALFASAWFLLLLDPAARDHAGPAAAWAALLAVSGFAADAVASLPPSRGRRLLVGALVPLGLVLSAMAAWVCALLDVVFLVVLPEVLALAAVGLLGGARLLLCRHPDADVRGLSRHVVAVVTASLLLCGLRFAAEVARGGLTGNTVLLCAVLVAEAVTLSYMLHERVAIQLPASRAVTHAVVIVFMVFAVITAFWWLGYPVDLVQVSVTVLVALLASLLFVGLGRPISRAMELLLYPKQVRLAGLLEDSRAEAAALRGRLERAERLAIAGELAASVAHEIKNPLAALRGYAELLSGQAGAVEPSQRERFEKAVRIIREESDRIDDRVAELLSLGRAPRGQRSGGTLEVSRVVLETVAVAEGEVGIPPILTRLDPELCVTADADALRGALLNLLKNAAEAMREHPGGRIQVVAREEAGQAVIEVQDEGHGLDGVDREQLFRPFYTTKTEGTGLGLAIARSAVEAAGGSLQLLPRQDARGAVARVTLPARDSGEREVA